MAKNHHHVWAVAQTKLLYPNGFIHTRNEGMCEICDKQIGEKKLKLFFDDTARRDSAIAAIVYEEYYRIIHRLYTGKLVSQQATKEAFEAEAKNRYSAGYVPFSVYMDNYIRSL